MTNRNALCVGINDYPGTGSDLSGCVNDAVDWAAELGRRGYAAATMLDGAATRAAFLGGVRDLVAATGYGDRAVLTYSGHGSWVPDTSGDEVDGRDEVLVLYDYPSGGWVNDDDLAEVLAGRRRGARIVFVSDSCHSGTVTRFVDLRQIDESQPVRVRFMPPDRLLEKNGVKQAHKLADTRKVRALGSGFDALLVPGCRDDEFSYDTAFGGRPNGAFTRVAIDQLVGGGTFDAWVGRVNEVLPSTDYPQTPHLSGSYRQRKWLVFD